MCHYSIYLMQANQLSQLMIYFLFHFLILLLMILTFSLIIIFHIIFFAFMNFITYSFLDFRHPPFLWNLSRCKTTHKHLIVNSLLLSNVDTETVSDLDNWMKWMGEKCQAITIPMPRLGSLQPLWLSFEGFLRCAAKRSGSGAAGDWMRR